MGWGGEDGQAAPYLGRLGTVPRSESAARRADGGGVPGLRKKETEQSESLTSPRPEAERSKFAPRSHSGASSLGPEATGLRPPRSRGVRPGVSGPRSRPNRTSASVAPALP